MLVLLLVVAYAATVNDPCSGPKASELLYQCNAGGESPAWRGATPVERLELSDLGVLRRDRWHVENRGPLPLIGDN